MSHETSYGHYVKIWALLLVLFVISVCGPMLEIKIVTLITAFGIAIVKAYIVATQFMHLNIEKKYITWLILSMVCFSVVLFMGIAPDTMKHSGKNWEKVSMDIYKR